MIIKIKKIYKEGIAIEITGNDNNIMSPKNINNFIIEKEEGKTIIYEGGIDLGTTDSYEINKYSSQEKRDNEFNIIRETIIKTMEGYYDIKHKQTDKNNYTLILKEKWIEK